VVGNGRCTVPCRDYETIANECIVRNEERCGERSLQQSDDFFTASGKLVGGVGHRARPGAVLENSTAGVAKLASLSAAFECFFDFEGQCLRQVGLLHKTSQLVGEKVRSDFVLLIAAG
jgi:hypothetical protein